MDDVTGFVAKVTLNGSRHKKQMGLDLRNPLKLLSSFPNKRFLPIQEFIVSSIVHELVVFYLRFPARKYIFQRAWIRQRFGAIYQCRFQSEKPYPKPSISCAKEKRNPFSFREDILNWPPTGKLLMELTDWGAPSRFHVAHRNDGKVAGSPWPPTINQTWQCSWLTVI